MFLGGILTKLILLHTYNLKTILGLRGSNNNVFKSILNLFYIIAFTCSHFSLSYICELLLENKARISCTPMWDILRLPGWCVRVDLFIEDRYEVIWMIKFSYIFADLLVPLGLLAWKIWVWAWIESGIWTCLSSWHGAGSTCLIPPWIFN